METLKKFTINFASLADGEHKFNYQADNKFLLNFEGALVHEADIEVKLLMHKFLNSLELNFEIEGSVRIPCDVCIEEFDLKMGFYIHLKLTLIIICSSLYMSYFWRRMV